MTDWRSSNISLARLKLFGQCPLRNPRLAGYGRVLPDAVLLKVRTQRLFFRSAMAGTAASRAQAISVLDWLNGPDPFLPLATRIRFARTLPVKQKITNWSRYAWR